MTRPLGMLPTAESALELTGNNLYLVYAVAAIAAISLIMGWVFRAQVLAHDPGTENMQTIGAAVEEGAQAYLRRQFRTLGIFVVLVFGLLLLLPADTGAVRWGRSGFFVVGALFSAAIGYLGMSLAVKANVRVAEAARQGKRDEGMKVAFRTGGTVGMATVGLGLLGASIVVLMYEGDAPKVLEGFGFGAALLAMFMRVGGGIFTKAADVGADLVGKVEAGIPEDDPRNAATIADNVGDNVGDCAGMAADLFESYAVTLVAALILGSVAFGTYGLVFPLIVPAIGAVTALLGVFITKARHGENALKAINRGFYIAAAVSAVLTAVAAYVYLPDTFAGLSSGAPDISALAGDPRRTALLAVLIGIVLAGIILWLTGYFTGTEDKPTNDVARTSLTGPATVVLSGIGVGLESAAHTPPQSSVARSTWRSCSAADRPPWRSSSSHWPAAACSPPSGSSSRWTPSARSPTTPRASPRCPATWTVTALRSSPSSTRSATRPRPSPRASRSRRRSSRPPPSSGPTPTPGAVSCSGSSTVAKSPRSRACGPRTCSSCRSSRPMSSSGCSSARRWSSSSPVWPSTP
ncbi:putative Inorganic diphosphatase [Nostocoides australiense Ben110]|uniref:Putative Inorganic diphosphatase n=1 Tax=Nostocoides australiense Ben110 TaxID=1193182 RepID=W6JUY3_9MICO|nr:putative Inorganic diphosphatase [Tetrasphaera australiensis Ben110]